MLPAKLCISPGAVLLLLTFSAMATGTVFLAVLMAIVFHELGHLMVLRLFGGSVRELRAGALGLEMQAKGHLSYGQELLALAAGPVANALGFALFGLVGRLWGFAYILGGAQLLLGLFNLLPICGLDGSSILWILTALLRQPDMADAVTQRVSIAVSTALVLAAGVLVCRFHSGVLLMFTALGLFLRGIRQMGLVKWPGKR